MCYRNKKKAARVGTKIIIPTNKFIDQIDLNEIFSLKNSFFKNEIKSDLISILGDKVLKPSLKVSYLRNYYIINNQIRLTYDRNINYERFYFKTKKKDDFEVCELKFLEENYKHFYKIVHKLLFTNRRFSKYLRGLAHNEEAIYF